MQKRRRNRNRWKKKCKGYIFLLELDLFLSKLRLIFFKKNRQSLTACGCCFIFKIEYLVKKSNLEQKKEVDKIIEKGQKGKLGFNHPLI